jgi:coenzyme F420-dependent glucose-6-phosphate dehydrogenase
VAAEVVGFACASASDHFHPWSERQGQSGFVWSCLGAAIDRANAAPVSHRIGARLLLSSRDPAQAGATLCAMYPDRLWMAVGTGQRLNEAIVGIAWRQKQERQARVLECVEITRALWSGETVTHIGRVTVQEARLFSLPERAPLTIGAPTTPETARWLGGWAGGMITLAGGPVEQLRMIVDAFCEGGGEGKPVLAQAKLAWGPDEEELREDPFRQWGTNLIQGQVMWEIPTPQQFEEATALLGSEDLDNTVRVSTGLNQHAEWLSTYAEAGVDELILHNVASNQAAFIESFGAQVLAQLR